MAIMRRCCCWNLRTATYANLITITILTGAALLLRLLDFGATFSPYFEINQSFQAPWRSHQWLAFVISDVVLIICHVIIIVLSVCMIYLVTNKHFVLYVETLRAFSYIFIVYIFVEFCISVFEFSFYGLNTFRLAFVVFLWLYWLARAIGNIFMSIVFFARIQEIEDDLETEIRSIDKKYVHSYVNF